MAVLGKLERSELIALSQQIDYSGWIRAEEATVSQRIGILCCMFECDRPALTVKHTCIQMHVLSDRKVQRWLDDDDQAAFMWNSEPFAEWNRVRKYIRQSEGEKIPLTGSANETWRRGLKQLCKPLREKCRLQLAEQIAQKYGECDWETFRQSDKAQKSAYETRNWYTHPDWLKPLIELQLIGTRPGQPNYVLYACQKFDPGMDIPTGLSDHMRRVFEARMLSS